MCQTKHFYHQSVAFCALTCCFLEYQKLLFACQKVASGMLIRSLLLNSGYALRKAFSANS